MEQVPKSLAIPVVLVIAAVFGNFYGVGAVLLTLAAGVLLAVVFTMWASVQNLTGDAPLTFEEALSLGAVTPEEERKRAVLRTLKDLDYERAVGKISDEDFRELSAQYRQEARDLLRNLDQELAPARSKAEQLLAERLRELLPAGQPGDSDGSGRNPAAGSDQQSQVSKTVATDTDPVAPSAASAGGGDDSTVATAQPTQEKPASDCPSCEKTNDDDATFCKHCGARLRGPRSPSDDAESDSV